MRQENNDVKMYDFTAIVVEVEFDKFKEWDVSKDVGNVIHKGTEDLGIDEIARTIYKEGKAEMTDFQAKNILAILMNSNLLAFVKEGIKKLFTI